MTERARFRLNDIKDAIVEIRTLLDDKTFASLNAERATRAAFERFLEIISEASRHIPEDWKAADAPEIPWRSIADLGNHIRHAYHKLDAEILWNVYEDSLGELEAAVDAILIKRFPNSPTSS